MYTRDEVTTGRMEREKKRRSGSRTKCKVNDDYDIRVKQLECQEVENSGVTSLKSRSLICFLNKPKSLRSWQMHQ